MPSASFCDLVTVVTLLGETERVSNTSRVSLSKVNVKPSLGDDDKKRSRKKKKIEKGTFISSIPVSRKF